MSFNVISKYAMLFFIDAYFKPMNKYLIKYFIKM